MLRPQITFFGVTAAALALCLYFLSTTPTPNKDPSQSTVHAQTEMDASDTFKPEPGEHDGGENPGWYDQWFEMRKDENGRIPRGLRTRWFRKDSAVLAQQATQRGAVSPFLNHTFMGPPDLGGRTRALLIDAANEDRIFAGAISGGLWRSDNAGGNWTPLNDAAVSLAVSCITQSPYNSNIIYYGTGESRGNSAGMPGDGVFKSNDGGLTFQQLASTVSITDMTRCWTIQHSKSSDNTVYVGTDGGLWRTEDAGNSWTEVFAGTGITDVITFSNGNVMLTQVGTGIFFSDDGDAGTFNPVTHPVFPGVFNRIEIAEYQGDEDIVYALFELPGRYGGAAGYYRSVNRGVTWIPLATPSIGNTYNTYCMVLGVSPDNPNRVVCGGLSMRTSTNGGNTWRVNAAGHADHHAYANFQANSNAFLMGSDGGVFRHSWTTTVSWPDDLNEGYHTSQFYAGNYPPTGIRALGGTQDNGTWRVDLDDAFMTYSNDGGFAHVSLQDGNIAYASAQEGDFQRSENFNAPSPNWTSINTNSTMNAEGYAFINAYQINYGDGDQLYCRTNEGLWRTTNRGTAWSKLTGTINGLFAIATTVAPNPTVYFGGELASFYRINNAATASAGTEVDLSASVPAAATNDFMGGISVHPDEETTLYIGFSSYSDNPKIWRVEDAHTGSPNWIDISGDLPTQLPVNYVQADPDAPDMVLFAATDFGLYYTTNGGVNWIKDVSVPNVPIFQAKLRESDRTLYLFTHGRGIWYVPLSRFSCLSLVLNFPYTESFEAGFGQWTQEADEDFDWSRRTGATGSANTGPSGAAAGSWYLYTEASGSNHPDKKAGLRSPCFQLNSADLTNPELSFRYHMLGETMGTLSLQIFVSNEAIWTTIWSREGNLGDEWKEAAIDLRPYADNSFAQFRFIGITENGFTSDMAIDDIRLGNSVNCTDIFPYTESFEQNLGKWVQYATDDLDWTQNTGGTPTNQTGPADGADGEGYIYVESSGNFNESAVLSACINLSDLVTPQFIFDYHMFGATMGSLTLDISTNLGGTWTTLWTENGNQGNAWLTDTVDLRPYAGSSFSILRWTGITGNSGTSDMALDHLRLEEGFCHSMVTDFPYAESFETGPGDWSQDSGDDFDWTRDSGGTTSLNTGPATGSDGSWYMYTEASAPNHPDRTTGLHACFDFSALGHPTVTFDKHLYGATTGTLTLQASTDLGCHWADLWSQSGNQGNVWNEVRLDLLDYAGLDMVTLRFVGVTASGFTGDMAIDNIQVFDDPCPPINFSEQNMVSFGLNQDHGSSFVEDGGLTLNLRNNSWKYIDFPYTVTPNTMIQLEFRSTIEGEIHGIGFDNDNVLGATYLFQFHGTQNYGLQNFNNYTPTNWRTYTIPVGLYYTGAFDRLVFVDDHDLLPRNGNSWFRNVRVFEGGCGPTPPPSEMEAVVPIYGKDKEPTPLVGVKVWPNPFRESVQVYVPDVLRGTTELVLSDLSGRVLVREAGSYAGQRRTFAAPDLPAGLYVLQVRNGDYQESFKLTKMD